MKTKKLNFFERFLNFFENVGNKMPDPVTLSFILCILLIIICMFWDLNAKIYGRIPFTISQDPRASPASHRA